MTLRLKSAQPQVISLTMQLRVAGVTDGALSPRTPCSCAKNENVLKAVKTNLLFHNHSWDFLHFPNAGVTLSLIAAE